MLEQLNNRLRETIFIKADSSIAADSMLSQLKEKFHQTTSREMKIKILSVLPKEWTIGQMRGVFSDSVSQYMIQQTKRLVEQQGILCDTMRKIPSTSINEETRKKVEEFYYSDGISRPCPGMRDYVKFKENGEKSGAQCRLILLNLKEAYELFKKDNIQDKIGFSKFASLRPPECVLAGSTYGVHVTCVCVYHQNVKLIFDTMKKIGLLADTPTYQALFDVMLCDTITDACRLNNCGHCNEGKIQLQSLLAMTLEEKFIEKLNFKQWMTLGGKDVPCH